MSVSFSLPGLSRLSRFQIIKSLDSHGSLGQTRDSRRDPREKCPKKIITRSLAHLLPVQEIETVYCIIAAKLGNLNMFQVIDKLEMT